MKNILSFSSMVVGLVMLSSCGKDPNVKYFYYTEDEKKVLDQHLNLPDLPISYEVDFPEHLSTQGLFPRRVSDDKATLGRVLFYDKKLSRTQTVACASCHQQDIGFSDKTALSLGVEDRAGDRNAIALSSVSNFSAYYGTDLNGSGAIRFLWDNKAGTASDQAKAAITNPKEMDMHMNEVVSMVNDQPYYTILFEKAYGKGAVINEKNVLDAIANFVDAMGSYDSKFDKEARKRYQGGYVWGTQPILENFAGFNASENRGKSIYVTKCGGCHSPIAGRPIFNYANNGLDATIGSDLGVGGVPEFAHLNDAKGSFKVPTLRNVELTGPYMHDGRFKTLEEVIEHYSTGVKNHPNLHNLVPVGGFQFTQQEKEDLLAFLKTFTDNSVAVSEKYANPFK